MSKALRDIVIIGILGLAAHSALAPRGGKAASTVDGELTTMNNQGNCKAFPISACRYKLVFDRCPEKCDGALKPQSTPSMLQMTSTTNPFSTPSHTSSSSSTTPSPTSSSSTTTPSPTSSSSTTTPSPTSSSSTTTPSPTSSSISTTPPPPSSSISTTPPPPTQTKEKNSRVGNFISFLSSTTSQLTSVLSTKAPTLTPAPDYDLIKTNQIPLEEQTNQGGVTNSNSNADVTSSVNEPSSSPLPASDKLITSTLPLSFPPPIDTKNQTIKESFYTKPPFIIGITISGALILGGAVGYVLRQINKKKEGAEDGSRNLEAQENNTDQAGGGNNTSSRAPSDDVDTDKIMIMIDTDHDDSLHTSKQAVVEIGDGIVNSQVPSTVSKTPALLGTVPNQIQTIL